MDTATVNAPTPQPTPQPVGVQDAAGAAAQTVSPTPPPSQAAAPPPAPPAQHNSVLSDILHAVGDVLGGPKTRQQVNPQTGAIENVPLSREQRIGNTTAMYLRAAGAGLAQHGPGAMGKAIEAGSQEEAQTEQRQRENTMAESRNIQSQQLQQATIAHQNNQQLLAQRQFDLQGKEFQQRVNDSNRQFNMLAQENGFVRPQILVDGKDINGTPGNEAEMMKYFSDAQAHKVPDGYSLMYVPTTDENGKMSHTVYQVPIDQMKKPVQVSADYFKAMTGLEPPTKGEVTTTYGGLIGLHSQFIESQLKQAEIKDTNAGTNLKNEQAKMLEGGPIKNPDGSWNPASLPVMLVEGNADPSQIKNARSGMSAQQIAQMASQYSMEKYGKPYDMATAQSDYKYATNVGTQNTLKYLNSLTGADNRSGNLGQLVSLSNQISRTSFPALNDAAAWARLQAGSAQMAAYHATVTEVSDQIAKILQGGGSGSGTSDAKLKQAAELFDKGFNKEQIMGVADTLRTLLANRKGELIGTNRYLQKQYGQTQQQQAGGPPPGATMKVPGSDGKLHWSDGKQDLGVAQ